jgi:hypothetical protein
MATHTISDKEALLSLSQLVRPPPPAKPAFDIIGSLPRDLAVEVNGIARFEASLSMFPTPPLLSFLNPPIPRLQVLYHLPVQCLLRAEQVCRLWHELAQDEGIWMHQVVS